MKRDNKNMKRFDRLKLYNFLIISFLILFSIPNFMILNNTSYIKFSNIFLIFILILINWKKIDWLENKNTIVVITIFTFIIRLLYVLFINSKINQISDFLGVFNVAKTMDFAQNTFYYQTAYHYFYYTFINGLLYKIFGVKQLISLLFNALILSSIPYFIYKICQNIFKNNKIGNIASLIYMIWPSMIIYTAILSPDHLSLFFLIISIYLIILTFDEVTLKKSIFFAILSGLNISLIGFFKNFSPVVLVALFIILFLCFILKKIKLKFSIIAVFTILFSYIFMNTILFSFLESNINGKVMKNQLGQYMYVGLSYETGGIYNYDRYNAYHQYLKDHNMDYKKANRHFLKILSGEIKQNITVFPYFLESKVLLSFEKDELSSWVVYSLNNQNNQYKYIFWTIEPINELFYIALLILTFIASLFNIIYDKNNKLLFLNLIIFGSGLMLLLAESQGRYKYTIEPLFCIMAAYGIYNGFELIKKLIRKNEVKK